MLVSLSIKRLSYANINLPLSLSPDELRRLVCGLVSPFTGSEEEKDEEEGGLCALVVSPSGLMDIIFSCRGAMAWKQPRDWKSAASFHLICLLVLLV